MLDMNPPIIATIYTSNSHFLDMRFVIAIIGETLEQRQKASGLRLTTRPPERVKPIAA